MTSSLGNISWKSQLTGQINITKCRIVGIMGCVGQMPLILHVS